MQNSHCFMAESLLSPWCNHTDLVRLNMFHSHLPQAMILNDPEFPRIYTGFEKQIGKYVFSSKNMASNDFTIFKVFDKNIYTRIYILVNEKEKLVDAVEVSEFFHITEDFGYRIKDNIKKSDLAPQDNEYYYKTVLEGKELKEGTVISNSFNNKDNLFSLGTNLKAVLMSFKGLTYEDGIVISESAAKKLSVTAISKVKVTINDNDILLNLYGNKSNYRVIPKIGEPINDGILCARRKISYDSIFYDFKADNMNQINFDNDDIFYLNGTVVDINLFSNKNDEQLEKAEYTKQLRKIKRDNDYYYRMIKENILELKKKKFKLIGDSSFHLRRATEMLDENKVFVSDKTAFNNMEMEVIVATETPIEVGSKIVGRYGNKGTISAIIPDEQMPYNIKGERPEVVLNVGGVINRLNVSQLFELSLNYISNEITNRIRKEKKVKDKAEIYFDYIEEILDDEQFFLIKEKYKNLSLEEKKEFYKDIEEKGIFIKINPFHDNPDFFKIISLFDIFDIKPEKYKIKIDDEEIDIERPLEVAEMYFLRLKHDAETKVSARSAGTLTITNVPSKNNNSYKNFQTPYSKTAIRFGEMEVANLFIINDIDEVKRFIECYSSNESARKKLILKLLGIIETENSPYNIQKCEVDSENNTKLILNTYLNTIGLELD
jgi:DNA-directed RNA polymerase beta subunit